MSDFIDSILAIAEHYLTKYINLWVVVFGIYFLITAITK